MLAGRAPKLRVNHDNGFSVGPGHRSRERRPALRRQAATYHGATLRGGHAPPALASSDAGVQEVPRADRRPGRPPAVLCRATTAMQCLGAWAPCNLGIKQQGGRRLAQGTGARGAPVRRGHGPRLARELLESGGKIGPRLSRTLPHGSTWRTVGTVHTCDGVTLRLNCGLRETVTGGGQNGGLDPRDLGSASPTHHHARRSNGKARPLAAPNREVTG